ncbi:MAG TPA: LCP family protein [Candidatus Limnocylindrales bacterium]
MPAVTNRRSRLRRARLAVVVVLTLAVSGSGMLPAAVMATARSPRVLDLGLGALGALVPAASADSLPTGSDGRFTILLLGSDFRTKKPKNGDRTDMIMVVTINPATGKMAVASIPRDTAYIPLANKTTYSGRVNELFKRYSPSGRLAALNKLRGDIGYALGVEIDAAALLRFAGFDALMDELGPITVTTRPAKDPKLWDRDPMGVFFPAASGWTLVGSPTTEYPRCTGYWRYGANTGQSGYECHRALMYARTRKGSKNSDFKRQARGVDIVLAAMGRAAGAGYSSSQLQDFVDAGQQQDSTVGQPWALTSTLPINLDNAAALYALVKTANLASVNRVVFTPKTYSTHISGTSKYRMNVTKVRSWIKTYFKNI